MAAMVRPSLILKMDFDERAFNEEIKSEIKRSYSYVAPSLVETHEAGEGRPENIMRFTIKVHRPYWDKNDAASEELWEGSMVKWLNNMIAKVSNTMIAVNAQHSSRGERTVDYAWLDLEFGNNLTIRVKLNADSSIPDVTGQIVAAVRDAACDGLLGEDPVLVSVPSYESWAVQLAAAEAELEAQQVAEEVVERDPEADGAAEENADQGIEISEVCEGEEAVDDVDSEALPEFSPLPEFEVDYRLWGVENASGEIREYDSVERVFIA